MKLPRTPNHLPTFEDMPKDEAGSKDLLFHAREHPSERVRNSHMPLQEISTLSMSFTQEATTSHISQTSSMNQQGVLSQGGNNEGEFDGKKKGNKGRRFCFSFCMCTSK